MSYTVNDNRIPIKQVVKCTGKIRDKNGKITAYKVTNVYYGKYKIIEPSELKRCIQENTVVVTNLTLTSDNRLVDSSNEQSLELEKEYILYMNSIQFVDTEEARGIILKDNRFMKAVQKTYNQLLSRKVRNPRGVLEDIDHLMTKPRDFTLTKIPYVKSIQFAFYKTGKFENGRPIVDRNKIEIDIGTDLDKAGQIGVNFHIELSITKDEIGAIKFNIDRVGNGYSLLQRKYINQFKEVLEAFIICSNKELWYWEGAEYITDDMIILNNTKNISKNKLFGKIIKHK